MDFSLVNKDGNESLVVIVDGAPQTVATTHMNFERIKALVLGGSDDTEELRLLINARTYVPNKLQRLSDRIGVLNDELTFDGTVIDTSLSRHIMRLVREGDDGWVPFVTFMENLALNPSPLSRIHLFNWLNAADFTITEDGMIVGYKSVQENRLSHHSGTNQVFVNDEVVTGHVPNPDGATVTIARTEVDTEREVECSTGLHVGTWNYARNTWSYGVVLKVLVNPRDVVSVPKDAENQKMRVCRYIVVGEVSEPNGNALEVDETKHGEPPIFSDDESDYDVDGNYIWDNEPEEDVEDEEDIEEEENYGDDDDNGYYGFNYSWR